MADRGDHKKKVREDGPDERGGAKIIKCVDECITTVNNLDTILSGTS